MLKKRFQLFARARQFGPQTAIISSDRSESYARLLLVQAVLSQQLWAKQIQPGSRIAFLLDPSFEYVSVQWAVWSTECIAVPLCAQHPAPSLKYVLEDSEPACVVVSQHYLERLLPICTDLRIDLFVYEDLIKDHSKIDPVANDPPLDKPAMMLYTSGTTSKPKGVVSTFGNIEAQIQTLVEAWSWAADDHILNVLPMHHVHGIVNILCCALWSGGCCQFLPKFDAAQVWTIFTQGQVNLFMAVPTIYHKLISHWEQQDDETRRSMSDSLANFRLMVSGSAALPVPVLEAWKQISTQTLLERYGMTEIGMALSNPYQGERRSGHVGLPLPGVQLRLVQAGREICSEDTPGEIQVKGPMVFKTYWNKPKATRAAFTPDGWFQTGDIAVRSGGYYRILGRDSVDIIKSGGYKISALEIESVMLDHPAVNECAVVGLPDEEWGEIVAAAIVSSDPPSIETLKTYLLENLPSYQVPRRFAFMDDLPKNTLGKVTKTAIVKYLSSD